MSGWLSPSLTFTVVRLMLSVGAEIPKSHPLRWGTSYHTMSGWMLGPDIFFLTKYNTRITLSMSHHFISVIEATFGLSSWFSLHHGSHLQLWPLHLLVTIYKFQIYIPPSSDLHADPPHRIIYVVFYLPHRTGPSDRALMRHTHVLDKKKHLRLWLRLVTSGVPVMVTTQVHSACLHLMGEQLKLGSIL